MPRCSATATAIVVAALAAVLALCGAGVYAVVCPNGGIDSDLDNICDSGYATVCVCGNNVNCNDNCIGVNNTAQLDFDCDGIGNGGFVLLTSNPAISLRCDFSPYTFDPLNLDSDGDMVGDIVDCMPFNATVPRFAPCPPRVAPTPPPTCPPTTCAPTPAPTSAPPVTLPPRSQFLLIFFLVAGGIVIVLALIVFVWLTTRGLSSLDSDLDDTMRQQWKRVR